MNNDLNSVSIIDYGLGNLKSMYNAIKFIGKEPKIINTPEEVIAARYLILPGVGAFPDGIDGLKNRNIFDALTEYYKSGYPLLGICLGMQLFMTSSDEFGKHAGLNLIKGRAVSFTNDSKFNTKCKIPHIGWNAVQMANDNLDLGAKTGDEVYFVHSFIVKPENSAHVAATTLYGETQYCSILLKDNLRGFQFHPEKSGKIGLNLLNSFCKSY